MLTNDSQVKNCFMQKSGNYLNNAWPELPPKAWGKLCELEGKITGGGLIFRSFWVSYLRGTVPLLPNVVLMKIFTWNIHMLYLLNLRCWNWSVLLSLQLLEMEMRRSAESSAQHKEAIGEGGSDAPSMLGFGVLRPGEKPCLPDAINKGSCI